MCVWLTQFCTCCAHRRCTLTSRSNRTAFYSVQASEPEIFSEVHVVFRDSCRYSLKKHSLVENCLANLQVPFPPRVQSVNRTLSISVATRFKEDVITQEALMDVRSDLRTSSELQKLEESLRKIQTDTSFIRELLKPSLRQEVFPVKRGCRHGGPEDATVQNKLYQSRSSPSCHHRSG